MKKILFICLALLVVSASYGAVNRDADEYQRVFSDVKGLAPVTNGSICVRTIDRKEGRVQFESSAKGDLLSRVRVFRNDGGMTGYEFKQGKLAASFVSSSNAVDGVMSIYIHSIESNSVSRIEFDFAGGRAVGGPRCYDAGDVLLPNKRKPSNRRIINKEYIPPLGMTLEVGPYLWTVVGPGGDTMLSRNGKPLVQGGICIASKYPWIVGSCGESRDPKIPLPKELTERGIRSPDGGYYVSYVFVLDVRTDKIEYINKKDARVRMEELGIGGILKEMRSFWRCALSNQSEENLQKLRDGLKAPHDEH